ncbi:Flp pilus assembly protein TadB [Paramagnetospirillum magnetotacticum MS-1]|uniref:Flp pilus assembly protein TadB n=1 Tax=Paramagnetospirillum magnetotacticum MS-1 TaxID=272627 RepID=A0A0C2YYG9_PARME|nr:type II secretion system F family protein [Paramagnetospirillum magnetotacticum]KIL99710.1 Flp pilus assembly protein TadB [Paramagnetospirillum magnetotacticum MS-1]
MFDLLERMPAEIAVLVAVMLVTLAVLGWSLFTLLHGPRARLKRRLAAVAGGSHGAERRLAGRMPQRKSVQARLKAVEGARARNFGWRLREQLLQAGWNLEVWHYLAGSGGLTLAVFALGQVLGLAMVWSGLAALCLGVGVPKLVLGVAAGKRLKAFTAQFADALDVVVRGIRSGLPLGECIAIIGREMPDPVGAEFRQITEGTRIGLTLHEAMTRAVERMPMAEMRYFAIVLAIQQQTGGNLAETLAKLSEVLRARKRMRDKVLSYAAEARASAAIIGSLPLLVVAMLGMLAPQYIGVLFTTEPGNLLLAIGILTEAAGVMVMRGMINFDI